MAQLFRGMFDLFSTGAYGAHAPGAESDAEEDDVGGGFDGDSDGAVGLTALGRQMSQQSNDRTPEGVPCTCNRFVQSEDADAVS
jgi:hypothetical protein